MKIQNESGIYVYYTFDKHIKYYYFENWNQFFKYFQYSYYQIKNDFKDWDWIYKTHDQPLNCYVYRVYYSVHNEDGTWYPVEYINIKYEEFLKVVKKQNNKLQHNRRHGRKKKAWGHYVNIKTFRSNKQAIKDIDIIELDLNVKYRNKAIPPNSWDREKFSHLDKSWKTQSKRKHQWK